MPSRRDDTSVGSTSRQSSFARVDLLTRWPRRRPPGCLASMVTVSLPQRGRAAGVGEGDPVEVDADRAPGQLDAVISRVGDIRGGADHPDDPAPPGDGVLQLVEDLGGLHDRHGEEPDEEEEGGQPPDAHPAVDREPGADDHDNSGGQPGDAPCPAVKA